MNAAVTYIGLDIAKDSLELSPHGDLKSLQWPNDAHGRRHLVAVLRQSATPVHVLCEATGGYERAVVSALHKAQIKVTVLNPRRVRDFARAKGLLAKTDRLDALALAEYGRRLEPATTAPVSALQRRLAALVTRRQDLVGLITQERVRREHQEDPIVRRESQQLISVLEKHLERIEEQIAALEQSDPVLSDKVHRLSAIQGVGRRTAWILLAAMPELGSLQRGQAAALAGVAPYNYDSGPFRGQRHIAHGRSLARRALYMSALVAARCNPVLAPYYLSLRQRGKPAKVALVALMRKLIELANLLLQRPHLQLT
jgi:transposase